VFFDIKWLMPSAIWFTTLIVQPFLAFRSPRGDFQEFREVRTAPAFLGPLGPRVQAGIRAELFAAFSKLAAVSYAIGPLEV
jgi:hypothetical protein